MAVVRGVEIDARLVGCLQTKRTAISKPQKNLLGSQTHQAAKLGDVIDRIQEGDAAVILRGSDEKILTNHQVILLPTLVCAYRREGEKIAYPGTRRRGCSGRGSTI